MSTERKKRLFGLALVVLAMWPAVQIGLVLRYDVSPWKLGAWGMYSSPQQLPGLKLRGFKQGVMVAPFDRPYPKWLLVEMMHFRRYRRAMGQLYSPATLGALILERQRDLDAVRLDVVEVHLNLQTAIVEERETRYSYERDGP